MICIDYGAASRTVKKIDTSLESERPILRSEFLKITAICRYSPVVYWPTLGKSLFKDFTKGINHEACAENTEEEIR